MYFKLGIVCKVPDFSLEESPEKIETFDMIEKEL